MSIGRNKLVIGCAAIALAAAYLGLAAARGGWVYYVDVDTYLHEHQSSGARARIHGMVAREGFAVDRVGLEARFTLVGADGQLAVRYRGAIPDLFECGREVIVEGSSKDGLFEADVLLTKCASKYESVAKAEGTEPGS